MPILSTKGGASASGFGGIGKGPGGGVTYPAFMATNLGTRWDVDGGSIYSSGFDAYSPPSSRDTGAPTPNGALRNPGYGYAGATTSTFMSGEYSGTVNEYLSSSNAQSYWVWFDTDHSGYWMWFGADQNGHLHMFPGGSGWRIGENGGQLQYDHINLGNQTQSPTTGGWMHVIYNHVVGGGSAQCFVYKNGQIAAYSTGITYNGNTSQTTLSLGARDSGSGQAAYTYSDKISFFNKALSGTESAELYNYDASGAGRFVP